MQSVQSFAAILRMGGATIYPLLVLAVVAAVVIVEKAFVFAARTRVPRAILTLVDNPELVWEELEEKAGELGPRNYFARFLRTILENRKRPAWWVESRATEEAGLIVEMLEYEMFLIA